MKSLSNRLLTATTIGLIGLSAIGKVAAQGSPPPTGGQPPSKMECIKGLNLTQNQMDQLALIKKEPASTTRKQKLEQFILLLSPTQKAQFQQCMKASKK